MTDGGGVDGGDVDGMAPGRPTAQGPAHLAPATAVGWPLLIVLVVTWLVRGPLTGPPLPPGVERPPGGFASDALLLLVAVPVVVVSLVVSLVVCRLRRRVPAGPGGLVRRGTGAVAVGLLWGIALWMLFVAASLGMIRLS
jgi:hypothetical protein